MFVIEVPTRVSLGLLVVFSGMASAIYALILAAEVIRRAVTAETVGSLIGSLLPLFIGVWAFRKLEARSRARYRS
jgi:hypothetical protein